MADASFSGDDDPAMSATKKTEAWAGSLAAQRPAGAGPAGDVESRVPRPGVPADVASGLESSGRRGAEGSGPWVPPPASQGGANGREETISAAMFAQGPAHESRRTIPPHTSTTEGTRGAERRRPEVAPGALAALEQRLGSLGLSEEQLRALARSQPELKGLGVAPTQDLLLAASVARVEPAEVEGFFAACVRRFGDLRTAGAAAGQRMAALPREVAANPEYRRAMEALRSSVSLDGLDDGRAAALHRAALAEARARFGETLRAELGLPPKAPTEPPGASRPVEWLEPARRRVVDATAAVFTADQAAAGTLQRLKTALTPEQETAVLEAHLRRTGDFRAERDAAAEALASALERSSLPPESLVDSYEALAATPFAETALRWASSQASDPTSPLRGTEALERVAAAAAEGAAADVIARASNPEAGVDTIAQYLAPLATTNMKRFELASAASLAKKLAGGRVGELGALLEGTLWNHPLARALQVTGLVAAVASTTDEVQQGELTAALRSAALAGLISHGLLEGAAASLANGGEAARLGGAAGRVTKLAEWSSRAFPAFLTAFYFASVAGKLLHPDKDVGTYLSLAGSCVSIAGTAVSMSGAGVVAGAALSVGGYALTGAGGLVSASLAERRTAEGDLALLSAANGVLAERGVEPLDDGLMQAITRPGVSLDAWASLALSPEAVQALLTRHPDVGLLGPARVKELVASAAALGVDRRELPAFLDAAKRRWGDLQSASLALGELMRRAPTRGRGAGAKGGPEVAPGPADARDVHEPGREPAMAPSEGAAEDRRREAWVGAVRHALGLSSSGPVVASDADSGSVLDPAATQ